MNIQNVHFKSNNKLCPIAVCKYENLYTYNKVDKA